MDSVIIKDHFFLTEDANLDIFCQSLKKVNIHYFTYLKNFKNGERIYLSNLPKWIEDYYNLALFKNSFFESSPELYHSSSIVWSSTFIDSPVLKHGRDFFDSDHGITLIRPSSDACEFYIFSTLSSKANMLNFYLNHLDFLESFIDYFNEAAKELIKKSAKHSIFLPVSFENKLLDPYLSTIPTQENDKIIEHSKKANVFGTRELSRRQAECIYYLTQGFPTKKIASVLNLSVRTIEFYLSNLRKKYGCRSNLELLNKLCYK